MVGNEWGGKGPQDAPPEAGLPFRQYANSGADPD